MKARYILFASRDDSSVQYVNEAARRREPACLEEVRVPVGGWRCAEVGVDEETRRAGWLSRDRRSERARGSTRREASAI